MEKQTEEVFIYFRETAWQSFLSDLFSYGFLAGTVWFNYQFIGGSYFMNGILLMMFLLISFSRASKKTKRFTNKEELKKYLKDL